MTIANRILLGFAAVIVLMIAVGLLALNQIGDIRRETETIITRDLGFVRLVSEIRVSRQQMQAAAETGFSDRMARQAVGGGEGPDWRERSAAVEQALQQARSLAGQYESNALSADRQQAWRKVGESLAAAAPILQASKTDNETVEAAIARGDFAEAADVRQRLAGRRGDFERQMQSILKEMDGVLEAGQARLTDAYELSRNILLTGLFIAVLLGIGAAYYIRNSIVGPLSAFMAFVERVGQGDLAGQTAATSKDEIGQLGSTLNAMVDGLKELARQSRDATENLNAATAEIRASTQEQAAGVEEQLAAVQETAATVDEITHSGAQISKRAQEVIASAQATAQTSTEGLRAVDETTRAMDAIRDQAEAVAENIVALSEKTQAIGDIIATVNDISERSHLLALNAAIEAAAAGEHGRSFSVVASEMKMLADQAKDATGQVRSILGDIQRGINASVMLTEEAVKRVAAGKERTDTTHRTITEITGRVQESVQTFQQIVASTNQQQLGIEQVMSALQNIRQASQQTAAGTRQLDEAAANLTRLSQQLLALAERYRL
ncbi:Methyl-accepting chemotaxis protein [Phenylobacterium zucineum HLK1]|uniref:Methyl-accepting chemotaxis protein n=1 Tax=Phenylobacterium zucineum (strain HLK1) TaxID=450851 RepID=B4RFM6_PHEZH|nr:methyl-accepting chemotaxis protein [Phenylobacterium zucineum]ACG77107.1 Methyl-accepting chemotaxis protein [Phenylobacterium zucineum HLK1]